MQMLSTPETNSFGLVLPPSEEELEYLRLFQRPKNRPDSVDRHHLYWPRNLYNTSKLSNRFREHRFNSIWILMTDHRILHKEYDGVPVPPRDVMTTFLDEAELLDELGVCVRAVEMIDSALYEGRVTHLNEVEENRQSKIQAQSSPRRYDNI